MFIDAYYRTADYFISYDWGYFLFWARIIAGIISAALVFATGIIVRKLMFYNRPLKMSVEGKSEKAPPKSTKEPWLAILKKMDSENPSDWNVAIMQADAIVDSILKEMGFSGEGMGERMANLDKSRLASLDDLWEAHRIRNEIAHSPEKVLTKHRAVYAISLFEKVLKEFGYLE